MSESFLSFGSSAQFRNTLIARNLAPYSVLGVFAPQSSNINYETSLTVSNVVDSPNNLVSTNNQANILYPLNEYGPDGGFSSPIGLSNVPLPIDSNKGPYDPNDTVIDLVNEFFIDAAFVQNNYGPQGGYNSLVSITDIVKPGKIYQPYWEPPTFVPSFYDPYNILQSTNPNGSNGSLSQDSYIVQLGSKILKDLLLENQNFYLQQNLQTQNSINFNITVNGVNDTYLSRLDGSYVPLSPIPGDYFLDGITNRTTDTLGEAINLVAGKSTLLGGALNGGLTRAVNQSQVFLQNTNDGQKGVLFANISKNIYRPAYGQTLLGGLGTNITTTGINNLIDNFGLQLPGAYYVGSALSEPSYLESPINAVPTDVYGRDTQAIVYGPDVLGKEYEKNEEKLNFGLKAKSFTNSGSIDGEFIWTSPKYKDNAGFFVAPGGAPTSLDNDFNVIEASYNRNKSTDISFKPGSILDDTQRLINSADGLQGEARLRHVGNAMNQVSKVFNDGYKELTKGSQVLRYTDNTNGSEAGIEYCRVFQKDTPYFTYSDLQKTDGITTAGRKFTYSVFDNTYNLNIAPLKGTDSTNIFDNKVKKYMFSIENLAWRTSDRPGYTYNDLPTCERGPNGGRIMWFPPYDISFSDDSKPDFNATSFLGRPEPLYTYKNTSRSGSLSWKIIVDSPASLNTIIEKQLANTPKERLDSIIDSFFAGCTKYDLYELGIKFNTIPTRDLYTYQELLNNPRLTSEEFGQIVAEIPTENISVKEEVTPQNTGGNNNKTAPEEFQDPFKDLVGLGFYFAHYTPGGEGETAEAFDVLYNEYISQLNSLPESSIPAEVVIGDGTNKKTFTREQVVQFNNNVIQQNFNKLSSEIIKNTNQVLSEGGKITFTLQGAASAPGAENNNLALAKKRISSVENWLKKQKDNNNIEYSTYIEKGQISIKSEPTGETTVLPQGETTFDEINCTQQPKELINSQPNITENASRNSLPAIACRRVLLKATAVGKTPPPVVTTTTTNSVANSDIPIQSNLTSTTKKPIPQVDVKQKIKEGISKKVLRQLFSECDYFQVIKETNPMVYDSFKEKIKYFSPAFHSTTPEGLNSRLTFLNQCMRPGQTIPVIGADGRPKYNDALNTAFGAPPILVLRVGDFYHSKIVPTNLSITYEPLLFDMNPEGIGIQPMIAKVTMAFNFIGGMGLKEPVEQLQNALSFNYYANTEVYDERATTTEDTSARDKYVVEQILNNQNPVKPIENTPPKKGENTIGNILSTTLSQDGTIESGDIEYSALMSDLSTQTNNYFKTMFNQLKTIVNTTNYGILQLVMNKTKYSSGKILEHNTSPKDTIILGKPESVESRIESLTKNVLKDLDSDKNPIIAQLIADNPTVTKKTLRDIKNELQSIINSKRSQLNQTVITPINELTKFQENYVQTFKKLDAVVYTIDGKKLETGGVKVLDLVEINGTTVFKDMTAQYSSVGDKLQNYNGTLISKNILGAYMKETTTFEPIGSVLTGDEQIRFYMMMSDTFTDEAKYKVFKEKMLNLNFVKLNTLSQKFLGDILDKLQTTYKSEFDSEIKLLSDFESSVDYKNFDTFKLDTIDTKVNYTTDVKDDLNNKTKIMKNTYSSVNESNKDNFNGKVKFN